MFINLSTDVKNFVFLVIFDTCDVSYNLLISLLPPIVLDNLFDNDNISKFFVHVLLTVEPKK